MFLVIIISSVFMLFYLEITIFIPLLSSLKLTPKVINKAYHKASPKFAPKVYLKSSNKAVSTLSPGAVP